MSLRDLILWACAVPLAAASASYAQEPITKPSSEDERAYLTRRQQEIFRLNVETDYALALQKLCQTGYGDSHLCLAALPKPQALPQTVKEPSPADLQPVRRANRQWVLQEITGVGTDLSAALLSPDGRRLLVRPGGILPGGIHVVAIEPNRVLLRSPGEALASLSLADDFTGGER